MVMNDVVYYKSVVSNASYRELWHVAGNPLSFAVAVIIKIVGVSPTLPFGLALLNEESVELADIPEFVISAVDEQLGELKSLGFSAAFQTRIPTIGSAIGYSFVLTKENAAVWATIPFAEVKVAGKVSREAGLVLTSALSDGSFLSTTNIRRRLSGPSCIQTKYLEGASTRQIEAEHQSRILDRQVVSVPARELLPTVRQLGESIVRFNIDRGVNVAMSSDEVERIASNQG